MFTELLLHLRLLEDIGRRKRVEVVEKLIM